jgi:hypothetical protein
MAVADWTGSLVEWDRQLRSLQERIGPVFGRREVRETAGAFVDGLLAGVERKTGWLLSEAAGVERPYRMQSLLGATWWQRRSTRAFLAPMSWRMRSPARTRACG